MAVDLAEVVPAIHAAAGLEEGPAGSGTSRHGRRFYREPLTDDLVVVYVLEDGGQDARILVEDDVARLGLPNAELRTRVLTNLRRRLSSVDRHGGPEVHMISAGGAYEASLLLLDGFWDPGTLRVDGDFVVAVPSRDLLMVTGSHCPIGVARLRQLAREGFERGRQPVTADLLVRRDGRWSVLPAWTSSRPAPRPGCLGFVRGFGRAKRRGA